MSNENKLAVELRENTGSGAARRLRHSGMIPAVIYGCGAENQMVSVSADAWKVWTGHHDTNEITLVVDGKELSATVREVQYNYLKNYVVHIDFQLNA